MTLTWKTSSPSCPPFLHLLLLLRTHIGFLLYLCVMSLLYDVIGHFYTTFFGDIGHGFISDICAILTSGTFSLLSCSSSLSSFCLFSRFSTSTSLAFL